MYSERKANTKTFILYVARFIKRILNYFYFIAEEHGFSFHSNLALPPQLSPYPPEHDDAVTVICGIPLDVLYSPSNTLPGEDILPIDITKTEAWDVSVKYKIDEDEYRKGTFNSFIYSLLHI